MDLETYNIIRIDSLVNNFTITGLTPWIKYRITLSANSRTHIGMSSYFEVDINGKGT